MRKVLIGLGLIWAIGVIGIIGAALYAQNKEESKKEPAPKQEEVSIWYLSLGNGFVVKTPKHLLIFDYSFPNRPKIAYLPMEEIMKGAMTVSQGQLPDDSEKGILKGGKTLVPKEIEDENTFVFITHAHADHYDGTVKKLKEKVKKIRYIVHGGRNLYLNYAQETFIDLKQEFKELKECTTFLRFGDTKEIEGLKVHAIFTTKDGAGCSYLVEVDKIIIAYINTCYEGAGESEEFIKNLPELIGNRRIDIAFDIGLASWVNPLARINFPDEHKPRLHIPNHQGDETIQITEQFAKEPKKVELKLGEKYIFRRDKE